MFVQLGEKKLSPILMKMDVTSIIIPGRCGKMGGRGFGVEPQMCHHELDTLGRSPSLVCSI